MVRTGSATAAAGSGVEFSEGGSGYPVPRDPERECLQLADGTVVDATTVIWCTGFKQVFDWIDLPITDENGWPREYRGVVDEVPGLFFCGLSFQFAFSSMVFPGVGRDAEYVARRVATRSPQPAAMVA